MKPSGHFSAKISALSFCLFLILLSFSSAAGAENSELTDISGTPFFKAAIDLNRAGIVRGYPDGTFRPYQNLSRAEATTMVCRAYGSSSLALISPYFFRDVADDMWAASYINYCAGAGILNGYPDGTFRPNAEVTNYEIITLIVRARGLDSEDMSWPDGYLRAAEKDGMLDNLYEVTFPSDGNLPASRGNTAALIASGSAFNSTAVENPAVDNLANPNMYCLSFGLLKDTSIGTDRLGNRCGWGRFLMGSMTYDILSPNTDSRLFAGFNPVYGLLCISIENGRAVSVERVTGNWASDHPSGLMTPASSDPRLTEFCRVVSSGTETLSWQASPDQNGTILLNEDTICYEIGLDGERITSSCIPVSEISINDMAAVFSVSDGKDADIVIIVHPQNIPDILHASDFPNIMYMG